MKRVFIVFTIFLFAESRPALLCLQLRSHVRVEVGKIACLPSPQVCESMKSTSLGAEALDCGAAPPE